MNKDLDGSPILILSLQDVYVVHNLLMRNDVQYTGINDSAMQSFVGSIIDLADSLDSRLKKIDVSTLENKIHRFLEEARAHNERSC